MANTFDILFPDHGYTEDMTAPNCINHGCGQPATYSGKDTKGNKNIIMPKPENGLIFERNSKVSIPSA